MIVNAYLHSFHMPIIITRCNNVFGPYQYPESKIRASPMYRAVDA